MFPTGCCACYTEIHVNCNNSVLLILVVVMFFPSKLDLRAEIQ